MSIKIILIFCATNQRPTAVTASRNKTPSTAPSPARYEKITEVTPAEAALETRGKEQGDFPRDDIIDALFNFLALRYELF